jgi:hypothetical protein
LRYPWSQPLEYTSFYGNFKKERKGLRLRCRSVPVRWSIPVILSFCSSYGEYGARGLAFILGHNRINVAISRVQCLAIVMGNPRIANSTAGSIGETMLLNLFCKLVGCPEYQGTKEVKRDALLTRTKRGTGQPVPVRRCRRQWPMGMNEGKDKCAGTEELSLSEAWSWHIEWKEDVTL